MSIQQILSRPMAVLALALLVPAVMSGTLTAATTGHTRHSTRHGRATAAAPGPAPVILTANPGTKLDADARKLNADDLQDAAKHHDQPVVLTGSAPLSSGKNDEALFVQLQSARLCGSAGCTTSVYLKHNNSWTTVLDSINGDISVLPTRHKGMHDLLVGKNDRWIWDGNQYQDTMSAPPMPKLNSN
ncbi:hypothetical protein [Gluconobacter morbifer]|uniref:Uncharacterized protein n=1 Tax=Gluconobacter morbifer G707 TaxID=1088869 RepID=G6XFU9_9PROT|nr:hypothetical protein [Gluconobacter morbifer]EHH69057.1 hypothetical protein GMO_03640 [Gluconobacter morbifer G707]